jgi:dCTP deaminase
MLLLDFQIKEALKKGEFKIKNYSANCIEPASYDMRIGPEALTTTSKEIINLKEKGFFVLRPGDFGVVSTYEIIEFPTNYVGRFGLKSKFARWGILAATGPQIDPGFRGRLFVGLINLSPKEISFSFKQKFLSIEFHKLEEHAIKSYTGPYQDQMKITEKEIEPLVHGGLAFSEVFKILEAVSSNVGELSADVKSLSQTVKWNIPIITCIVAFGIGIIAIITSL